MKKNKSQSHAESELEILEKTVPDAIVTPFKKEIIALCKKFGNSGQSGGSAPYTATAISQAVKALMMHETLAPLTGEDDEWVNVSDMGGDEELYQNYRDSRVFKNGKNGKAYFLDAIVFDGDIGGTFTTNKMDLGNGKSISSFLYIKSFPFTPKTFYVDVIDHRWKDEDEKIPDENGDWWSHTLKDESQLKEVFEYYDEGE